MLLAIDVGNSETKLGFWDGDAWAAIHRHPTGAPGLAQLVDRPFERAVGASVVPSLNSSIEAAIGRSISWLTGGVPVVYDPPESVGADRLANALGAIARYPLPAIVVDCGTATNFDVVGASGRFIGGAIMPGLRVGSESLLARAAKLPSLADFELRVPPHAIGRSTAESLQSGILLGYAEAVDGLVDRMTAELGGTASVIATGGLAHHLVGVCRTLTVLDATLTLDGLRAAARFL